MIARFLLKIQKKNTKNEIKVLAKGGGQRIMH